MFILISFDNIEKIFAVSKYNTHKEAWDKMLSELREADNNKYDESYKEDADEDGYVDGSYDYGISQSTAFANCSHDMDCDWLIAEVDDTDKYVVVSLCDNDRDICCSAHSTVESAWGSMRDEWISFDSGYCDEVYADETDENGCIEVETDEYGIDYNSAWISNDDMACDWKLIDLSEL